MGICESLNFHQEHHFLCIKKTKTNPQGPGKQLEFVSKAHKKKKKNQKP